MRRDGPRRVVAVFFPDLPLQRVRRSRTTTADGPLAIVEAGRVVNRDPAAAAQGVRVGATAAEALAACGRLVLLQLDTAADRAALRAVAEAMMALAPVVEVSPPYALLLDASGAALLAPPAGKRADARAGEDALARRAIALAAEMGYAARAAVATGRGPALVLARHAGDAVAWAAPGETARELSRLPVSALGLPSDVASRLGELGIADAGALSRLPAGTLAHRFGPAGVLAARLARGEDDSPLVPYVPETLPQESLELEGPAESADPVLFALKRLADRVSARLAGRGLGATRLRVVLGLDPRGEERIQVPLAHPTASAARWLLPLKEHLFSLRLPGAVTGLRLAVVEVAAVAPEQLAIGDRPEAIAALDGVLARIGVRLGDGAAFAAEPVERHRPEAAYRAVPFRPKAGRRSGSYDGPSRPTRLLAAPSPVVAEGEGGRLTALRIDGRARAVLAMEGPERLRAEWWGAPFDRDYYRVRLDGLGECWVYRDGGDGRLYLHGFFD